MSRRAVNVARTVGAVAAVTMGALCLSLLGAFLPDGTSRVVVGMLLAMGGASAVSLADWLMVRSAWYRELPTRGPSRAQVAAMRAWR